MLIPTGNGFCGCVGRWQVSRARQAPSWVMPRHQRLCPCPPRVCLCPHRVVHVPFAQRTGPVPWLGCCSVGIYNNPLAVSCGRMQLLFQSVPWITAAGPLPSVRGVLRPTSRDRAVEHSLFRTLGPRRASDFFVLLFSFWNICMYIMN